jgi:chaperone modulatory protein CbpM
MNPQVADVVWLDAREAVTLPDLSRAAAMSAAELNELVDYGALVPLDPGRKERLFSAEWVTPLRTAGKLRMDFDLDLFTVAIILDYLNRIEHLERQLRSLKARVPQASRLPREGPGSWREPHA